MICNLRPRARTWIRSTAVYATSCRIWVTKMAPEICKYLNPADLFPWNIFLQNLALGLKIVLIVSKFMFFSGASGFGIGGLEPRSDKSDRIRSFFHEIRIQTEEKISDPNPDSKPLGLRTFYPKSEKSEFRVEILDMSKPNYRCISWILKIKKLFQTIHRNFETSKCKFRDPNPRKIFWDPNQKLRWLRTFQIRDPLGAIIRWSLFFSLR